MGELTKRQQLWNWMRRRKYFSTHQVLEAGLYLYYTRADRTKREFLAAGLIRHLTDEEFKKYRIKSKKEGWYKVVDKRAEI